MVKVLSIEGGKLARVVDDTFYSALTQTGISADEPSLKAGFEKRVEQLFDEFRQKHPAEDVAGMEKAVMNGIPDYIQAAKGGLKHERNEAIGTIVSSIALASGFILMPLSVGAAVGCPASLQSKSFILFYTSVPLIIGGALGVASSIIVSLRNPLTAYREKYRGQIIDAFQS